MNLIKKIFRPLATKVVVIWANYTYDKVRRIADQRHEKEHTMIYVCAEPFRPYVLTTYDRKRFKGEKKVFGYSARLLTLTTLKNGCYYHTPDTAGNQALGKREIKRRRRYFALERLHKAGLL